MSVKKVLVTAGALMAVAAPATVAATTPRSFAQGAPSPAAALPTRTALAWGGNAGGQLGDGTSIGRVLPVEVAVPSGVTITAVAVGAGHSLGLTSTGSVLAWGGNSLGQLGDGTTIGRAVPVEVAVPSGVTITAVAAGGGHSLGLTSTGSVLAWGGNSLGQLGDGTTIDRAVPVEVDLPSGVTITAVAAGIGHSLALSSAGDVLSWGRNLFGQLGDGSRTNRRVPVGVDLPAGTTITDIVAGGDHSLALTGAGTVLAWGHNLYGQLGDATGFDRESPVSVALPAGTTITSIAAGSYHSLAVTSAGALLGWGHNLYGQLGDGTPADRIRPVDVYLPPGATIDLVAAGSYHSLAVTSAGDALAWGRNIFGQVGDGSTTDRDVPVSVVLPADVTITAVAAGYAHSLALASPAPAEPPASTTALRVSPPNPRPGQDVTFTATVTCTAGDPAGAVTFLDGTTILGTATLSAGRTAIATLTVEGLTRGDYRIRAYHHSGEACSGSESRLVAVTVEPPTPVGTGLAWGHNELGKLGDRTETDRHAPVGVALLAGVTITDVAAGFGHSLALTSTGAVLAWGDNSHGQLGTRGTGRYTPGEVDLPADVRITAIAAGGSHSLALTSAGNLLAWGDNDEGQLGDGTNLSRATPVEVLMPAGIRIVAIAAGEGHSLALTSAGTVYAWGFNLGGQVGDGTNHNRYAPVEVVLPASVTITAVAAGGRHSLGVASTGAVLAWGDNSGGQLGDGSNINRNLPVEVVVPGGTRIVFVVGGGSHSLGLTSTGAVLAWGANFSGQLGDGTNTNRNLPVEVVVPGGTRIVSVVGGGSHSLGLTSTGAVLAWGANFYGQLGDGANIDRDTPVRVKLPAGATVVTVAAGYSHSLAIPALPPGSSTINLRLSPPNPRIDQEVTLTATMTCSGGVPTGTVSFLDRTITLGTVFLSGGPAATATLGIAGLETGSHTIRAHYAGTDACPASSSNPVTVTVAPPGGTGLGWGSNYYGELGDGTTDDRSRPIEVGLPAGVTITGVAAGSDSVSGAHSLAVTSTGTVLAWGGNYRGQLGDGTRTDRSRPVEVELPSGVNITAVAAGGGHSLALTTTGKVLAWGYNGYGQLGNGTRTNIDVPVQVDLPAGTTVTAIAAGGFHSLALTSTGNVLAWGYNGSGQVGNVSGTFRDRPAEATLPTGTTVTAISAGYGHSLALTATGAVIGWGDNTLSQLGDGTAYNHRGPVDVALPADTTVTAISTGYGHSLALTSTGAVLGWGANSRGELGDGTNGNRRATPIEVDLPTGVTVTALTAGSFHSLALTSSGKLLAWGSNSYGELGDGTRTDRNVPVPVDLPIDATITAVVGGSVHSLAIAAQPATSITTLQVSPRNPRPGEEVTLTATVTCSTGTPVGSVAFFDGAISLGTGILSGSPNAAATLTVTSLSPGRHTIQARFAGDNRCPASESLPVTVTVSRAVLPITGVHLPAYLAAGVLIVVAGVTLLLASRRRLRLSHNTT